MVSSNGIFVHKDTKLFETYYSSSSNGDISFIISAKECVLLIVYLFLQRGI